MRVSVVFTARECNDDKVKNKSAVVIDVLRATTVITTALNNGATAVMPFKTVDEAKKYAEKYTKEYTSKYEKEYEKGYARKSGKICILGGERNAMKIDGFDLGNSPLEYTPEYIGGKDLIITTTNGTMALEHSKSAKNLYLMCFLNCAAVSQKLLKEGEDAVLVCAGTGGQFSTDDCLCAGRCIKNLCDQSRDIELDDAGRFIRDFYDACGADLKYALRESRHYKYLIGIGMAADVDYCLQTDLLNIVPFYENDRIVAGK